MMLYRVPGLMKCFVLLVALVMSLAAHGSSTPEELKAGHFSYLLSLGRNLELLAEMDPKDRKRFDVLYLSARQELGLVTNAELDKLKRTGPSANLSEQDRFLLAKVFIRNNDCKEGLRYLKGKGLQLDSQTQAERAYYRAMCFIDYGHHNFAAQALSSALEGEWAANAYYNLATDYLNTKRNPKKALISLRVARDINTEAHESASELSNRINLSAGSIYLENEKPELANDFFNQIPLDSRYVTQGLYLAGLAKAEKRDFRGAIQVWQANLKHALIEPGVADSLLALPMIQHRSGYQSQALESYLEASNLIDEEINTLQSFRGLIEKYGVRKVLFEDADNNELEWYLDKTKAKNTQRIAYLNYLANQKEVRSLMDEYFQLRSFEQKLVQSRTRLNTHQESLKQQRLKIAYALDDKGHRKWVSRLDKLKPLAKQLESQLSPSVNKDLDTTIKKLNNSFESIDERLKRRYKAIKSHLKSHEALTKRLNKGLNKLNKLTDAYEKELSQVSLESLAALEVELVQRYEQAELGLIGILDSLARLRTKRTNLLDGRYQ